MLAIFKKSAAMCPDTFKEFHRNSFSALENGFLVNQFASLHPDHVVMEVGDSAVFAYSLKSVEDRPRFRFGSSGRSTFCLFKGSMEHASRRRFLYNLNPVADELSIVIRACLIMKEVGLQTPMFVARNLIGDFSFIYYDNYSKFLIFSPAKSGRYPFYWGINSESSLILTDVPVVMNKSSLSPLHPFPSDHLYISHRGYGGLEAIFHDFEPEIWEKEMHSTDIETIWQPPPPGFIKINTHGVEFPREKMLCIGVIIRDSSGNMIVAGSKKIKGFTSVVQAQGFSITEALTFALQAGFRDVVCESMLMKSVSSAFGEFLISELYRLMAQFTSIKLGFIPVSANKAAIGLAEYAKKVDDYMVWVREAPEFISSVVETDSHGHTGPDPTPQSS